MAKVKLQITMEEALLKRLEEQADELYMNRSALVSLAVTQYLNQAEAVSAVKSMAVTLRKIADEGSISDDARRELDDFERMARLFVAS